MQIHLPKTVFRILFGYLGVHSQGLLYIAKKCRELHNYPPCVKDFTLVFNGLQGTCYVDILRFSHYVDYVDYVDYVGVKSLEQK